MVAIVKKKSFYFLCIYNLYTFLFSIFETIVLQNQIKIKFVNFKSKETNDSFSRLRGKLERG